MLSGPRQKLAEGVVAGLSGTDAYAAAHPRASRATCRANAARELAKADMKAEIARLRALAAEKAGSAVLTLAEKRRFVARLVRANLSKLNEDTDGDLIQEISDGEQGRRVKLGNKLDAIKLDNDLAGEGSEAGANDEIAALLRRLNDRKNESSDA